MDNIYLRMDGKLYGPANLEAIQGLKLQGKISGDALISKDKKLWQPIPEMNNKETVKVKENEIQPEEAVPLKTLGLPEELMLNEVEDLPETRNKEDRTTKIAIGLLVVLIILTILGIAYGVYHCYTYYYGNKSETIELEELETNEQGVEQNDLVEIDSENE